MNEDEIRDTPLYELFLRLADLMLRDEDNETLMYIAHQSLETHVERDLAWTVRSRFWWFLTFIFVIANVAVVLRYRQRPVERERIVSLRAITRIDTAEDILSERAEDPT